jgi:outer membrane protein TolC
LVASASLRKHRLAGAFLHLWRIAPPLLAATLTLGLQSLSKSRRLRLQLLRHFMVLSGFTFQRVLRRAVLACFLVLVAPAAVFAQLPEVAGTMPEDYFPDLKRILDTAAQRSPRLLEAEITVAQREANRIGANAPRWPSLGTSFSYGTTELSESGNANSSRDNGLFGGIALNQALYHWGALKNQSAIGRINLLIAQKNYTLARRELGILLRRLYLELIVQKAKLRHGRESLDLLRAGLKIAAERRDRGAISPGAYSAEEFRLRENALKLGQLELQMEAARSGFARLAGIGEFPENLIPDAIPKPMFSESLVTAVAATILRDEAKTTLEAQVHDLRVEEALRRYRIARTGLLPKFGIAFGYSLENTTTVGVSVGQRAVARQTAGIGVSWPLFDGFATRAAKMEARVGQRAAAARRDLELEAIQLQVRGLERRLKLDGEELEIFQVKLGQTQEHERRTKEEVELGTQPRADIARVATEVLLAEATVFEVRAGYLQRWSELVALAGIDRSTQISPPHDRDQR